MIVATLTSAVYRALSSELSLACVVAIFVFLSAIIGLWFGPKTLSSFYSNRNNLDISVLFGKFLDYYVLFITRRLPARHQYIHGQDKLHKTKGQTFLVKGLTSSSIYTVDPRNIQTAWSSSFEDWGVGPIRLPALEAFVGRGLINTDGDEWWHGRKVAKEGLAKKVVSDMTIFKAVAEKYFEHLPRDGKTPVDIHLSLFNMYFESSYAYLTGKPMDAEVITRIGYDVPTCRARLDTGVELSKIRSLMGPLRRFWRTTDWAECQHFVDIFAGDIAGEVVRWREDKSADHTDPPGLAHRFALAWDDPKEVQIEVMHFLMAAPLTVCGLMTHVFAKLAERPDIWERLREEINDAPVDLQELSERKTFKLLHNVVIETLRLYPSAALSSRVALRTTILPRGGGSNGDSELIVPKGAKLHVNILALHREESVFGGDSCGFNPDRWNHINPKIYEFMPFSRGKRGCLGKEKAMLESKYLLYRLAQEFQEIKLAESVMRTSIDDGVPKSLNVILVPA